ncbi:metalloregulator ArsR/SmtB family transcription factor [Leifsonia shinshuensis]|uniref:ArsR/SmtB family transcription factor n=1 Tax=Leifsonia shinshuensis TaxID=150026 RepID=UPI001F5155B6|nr:metalloregulator ArsR/SmtB family transcription factor [Leifsonia shinshuensis]MCI0158314.1 metalloregulator ArsR/SmtB family transcription factor [Leifsonia shinshuensis]
MDGLEAVGDPVRRRFVELLAHGEHTAGELAEHAADEFGISQPATSRHLRVLREAGVVASRVDGQRRVYALDPDGLRQAAAWFDGLSVFCAVELSAARSDAATPAPREPATEVLQQRLDALGTELARGRSAQRRATVHTTREAS